MKIPSCASCRFFTQDDFGNDTCRRRAPVPIFMGRELATVWPLVTPAHWCGEFEALPPLPKNGKKGKAT